VSTILQNYIFGNSGLDMEWLGTDGRLSLSDLYLGPSPPPLPFATRRPPPQKKNMVRCVAWLSTSAAWLRGLQRCSVGYGVAQFREQRGSVQGAVCLS